VFVVFTLPETIVARLDISRGPCLPKPGNKRPMVGVTRQEPGDPAIFESLAAVLLGGTAAPDLHTDILTDPGDLPGPGAMTRLRPRV